MSLTTLALHAQRIVKHAILTLITKSNNARHVMLGLYLIQI